MPPAMLQGNKASQQVFSVKRIAFSVKPGGPSMTNLQANSPSSAQDFIWGSRPGDDDE